jgi:hypothetical protein
MKKQASPTLQTEQSERPVERLPPAPSSDSPSTVLALIERVALDPHADVEKLERVMAMYERLKAKEAELAYNAAKGRIMKKLAGRLLEQHDLGRQPFDEVQRHLAAVDATIINAPSSTKNTKKARDPEMHQTKKGNQWYFGMKAHIGVDSRTKLIHAAVATSANIADGSMLPDLLHGNKTACGATRRIAANGR